MKYRKSVFIVTYCINDKSKIYYLLLKRKLHWKGWEFPKGGIETKENLIKTVKREIKEETGQIPTNITKRTVTGKFKYDKEYADRKGLAGQTYKLFSAELKHKKIKVDNREHLAYKWVDFETAWKMLKWPNQKNCLLIVNIELENEKSLK